MSDLWRGRCAQRLLSATCVQARWSVLTLLLMVSCTMASATATVRPILRWKLDDMYSSQVSDSVGSCHAQLNGQTHGGWALSSRWQPGAGIVESPSGRGALMMHGKSSSDDGGREYAFLKEDVGCSNPSFILSTEFTASMWLKRDEGNSPPTNSLLWNMNPTGPGTGFFQMRLNGNQLECVIAQMHPAKPEEVYTARMAAGTAFKDTNSTWTHLACTLDTEGIRAFANGVRIGSFSRLEGMFLKAGGPSAGQLQLGHNNAGIHGLVDDVRLYSSSLSDVQVAALYNRDPEPEPPVITTLPITAWGAPATVNLRATVAMPQGAAAPNTSWRVLQAPAEGTVTFSGGQPEKATFSTVGAYTLLLTAVTAEGYNVSSQMKVAIFDEHPSENQNQAPVVSIGDALADTYPTGTSVVRTWCNVVTTKGWVSDDGRPSMQKPSLEWTVLAQPAPAVGKFLSNWSRKMSLPGVLRI